MCIADPHHAHNYPDAVGDGKKGKTWGPSSVQKDRHQRSSIILADGRWSKSAPNLEKSLRHLGGHSNVGAFNDLCEWFCSFFFLFVSVLIFGGDKSESVKISFPFSFGA